MNPQELLFVIVGLLACLLLAWKSGKPKRKG